MADPTFQGHVDYYTADSISGWAHDESRPDQPVAVTLYLGGKFIATLKADAFRPDLLAAGMGDGRKVFRFNPGPYLSGRELAVRVVFAATGGTIPNGRARLARPTENQGENFDTIRALQAKPPVADRLAVHPSERWPLISLVVPVYNPPLEFIERAVRSVLAQTYAQWELLLVDDASPNPAVAAWLKSLAGLDPRIKVRLESTNRGISRATNLGINDATGDFIAFLDHDDELTLDALAEVACVLLEEPATDVVFTDQDKIDEQGQPFEPFHKPSWSPVFFLGVMYVGHLLVARASLVRKAGGCDPLLDKVQDFDLMLRLSELTTRIAHIPKILYHWRTLPGSLASSSNAKDAISELQVRAAQGFLDRQQWGLRAVPHPKLPHRVQLQPGTNHNRTRVSIIIPTKDAPGLIERCLDSIFQLTTHRNFEVIVVDTGTTDERARAALRRHPIRLLEDLRPFNFSRVNNLAAAQATGDVLLFLNNDTEVVTPDWLEIMLAHLALPNVGAVGPLLLYPDGTVQHAGIVLGFRGTGDHVMRGFTPGDDGAAGSLACSREVTAVTAACLMMTRALYQDLGGMNEAFATIYQDFDLCLKIRAQNRSILYVANAVLKHHESVSRGARYDFVDRELLRDRWQEEIRRGDPYHNANFTLNRHDYTLRSLS